MAATLSLEGRILTITDEGESSSVDLANVRGDQGIKGARGAPGTGTVDLSNYYTKEEVNELLSLRNA